jgi:hypothetical protein
MIIPVAALLLILSVRLVGGRLSRLALVRLRWLPLVLLALAAQVVVLELPVGRSLPEGAVHNATYLAAAVFILINRRVPGLPLIAAGAASNGVTIALNGGVLPASASALARAGIEQTPGTFTNSGVIADPKLAFLGDVFAIPAGLPLANVFSIGDLLIVLGAGYAAYRICGTFWWGPWDAAAHGHGYRPLGRHRAMGKTPRTATTAGSGPGVDVPVAAPPPSDLPPIDLLGRDVPVPELTVLEVATDDDPPCPTTVTRRRSRRRGPSGRQRTGREPSTTSGGATPDPVAAPDDTMSLTGQRQIDSGQRTTGEPGTREPEPGELVPGELVPGELVPGELVPGELVPGELVPGELVPADQEQGLQELIALFPDSGPSLDPAPAPVAVSAQAQNDGVITAHAGTKVAARTRLRIPWPRRPRRLAHDVAGSTIDGPPVTGPGAELPAEQIPEPAAQPPPVPGPPVPGPPDPTLPDQAYPADRAYPGGDIDWPTEVAVPARPMLPVQPAALTITPRKGRLGPRFRSR